MDWKSLTDCKFYLLGNCTNKKCVYRHPANFTNRSLCKFWVKYQCKNIDCLFRHPVSSDDLNYMKYSTNLVTQDIVKPNNDSQVCRFFMLGKCKSGLNCHYLHGLPEIEFSRYNKSEESKNDDLILDLGIKNEIISISNDIAPIEASIILEKYSMKSYNEKKRTRDLLTIDENAVEIETKKVMTPQVIESSNLM